MFRKVIGVALLAALFAGPAQAQQASSGVSPFVMNTLFIVFCGVLVMWMTAGFAMLEAGFVREKNVVSQCAKNIGLFAIASTAFILSGYGFMFPNGNWILPGILGFDGTAEIMEVVDGRDGFVGRGHAGAADIFMEPLRRVVEERALPRTREGLRIEFARLGADAGIIGAAGCALTGLETSAS